MISSHCTWLVVVGGHAHPPTNDYYDYDYDDNNDDNNDGFITHPNTTMIVELGKSINYYMLIIFIQYIMIVNGLWDVY